MKNIQGIEDFIVEFGFWYNNFMIELKKHILVNAECSLELQGMSNFQIELIRKSYDYPLPQPNGTYKIHKIDDPEVPKGKLEFLVNKEKELEQKLNNLKKEHGVFAKAFFKPIYRVAQNVYGGYTPVPQYNLFTSFLHFNAGKELKQGILVRFIFEDDNMLFHPCYKMSPDIAEIYFNPPIQLPEFNLFDPSTGGVCYSKTHEEGKIKVPPDCSRAEFTYLGIPMSALGGVRLKLQKQIDGSQRLAINSPLLVFRSLLRPDELTTFLEIIEEGTDAIQW